VWDRSTEEDPSTAAGASSRPRGEIPKMTKIGKIKRGKRLIYSRT
ncbi:unnamed protein product, partial [Brassica oleracea]